MSCKYLSKIYIFYIFPRKSLAFLKTSLHLNRPLKLDIVGGRLNQIRLEINNGDHQDYRLGRHWSIKVRGQFFLVTIRLIRGLSCFSISTLSQNIPPTPPPSLIDLNCPIKIGLREILRMGGI